MHLNRMNSAHHECASVLAFHMNNNIPVQNIWSDATEMLDLRCFGLHSVVNMTITIHREWL